MKYVPLLFATLALAGCATQQPAPLTISGETAFIRGQITHETAQSFRLKNVAVLPDYALSDLAPCNAGAENLRFVATSP